MASSKPPLLQHEYRKDSLLAISQPRIASFSNQNNLNRDLQIQATNPNQRQPTHTDFLTSQKKCTSIFSPHIPGDLLLCLPIDEMQCLLCRYAVDCACLVMESHTITLVSHMHKFWAEGCADELRLLLL